jgi:hypothetical protein
MRERANYGTMGISLYTEALRTVPSPNSIALDVFGGRYANSATGAVDAETHSIFRLSHGTAA